MGKRLFQVLDEMNVNDEKNKTSTVGCCFEMVSADTVKAGGVVKMGVPAEAITRIFLGECQPFLILLDKKEYHRLKDQPVAMSEAEQLVKELEQWKKEASVLLNPLLEYGQAQKDMPLGRSITQELLRRAKMYKEVEDRATAHENTLKLLMGYFVKCHNNSETPDLITVIHSIDEALTPKSTTDDTTNG